MTDVDDVIDADFSVTTIASEPAPPIATLEVRVPGIPDPPQAPRPG